MRVYTVIETQFLGLQHRLFGLELVGFILDLGKLFLILNQLKLVIDPLLLDVSNFVLTLLDLLHDVVFCLLSAMESAIMHPYEKHVVVDELLFDE